VIPAYGSYTEVTSPGTSGGTTSVSVTLPQGPSVLQAVTSYTITVALGNSLSRFAQNERVEMVELMAALGQAAQTVRLITVSGKQYEVPASILQIAGGNG
jgi:LysM repeat protein